MQSNDQPILTHFAIICATPSRGETNFMGTPARTETGISRRGGPGRGGIQSGTIDGPRPRQDYVRSSHCVAGK